NFGASVNVNDLAVALARTAAYFSNDQAPLSSRTVRFISGIHFPPGVTNTQPAPLYGIENTNRGCILAANYLPGQSVSPSLALGGGTGPGIITGSAGHCVYLRHRAAVRQSDDPAGGSQSRNVHGKFFDWAACQQRPATGRRSGNACGGTSWRAERIGCAADFEQRGSHGATNDRGDPLAAGFQGAHGDCRLG